MYERIINESQSHIVHPGLDFGINENGTQKVVDENKMLVSILEAPGVVQGAWVLTHCVIFCEFEKFLDLQLVGIIRACQEVCLIETEMLI